MNDDTKKSGTRPGKARPTRKDGPSGPRKGKVSRGPGRPHGAARPDDRDDAGGERIAKRLARAGVASRRDAEAMIADGRIAVNGKVLDSPARNVGPKDRIEIDGKPIPAIERTRLFLFHKPAGLVTTHRDPQGRDTVFDALPKGLPRLISVGRLDINTEGLILFTNDGGLARVLELPATGWLRRYRVRVHGRVDEAALAGLAEGIAVDGVFYGAVEASLERVQGSNAWLSIGLREGKNREVKNIMAALGLDVTRLIRVSYGPFQLGDLPEGQVRELKGKYLRDQLGPRLIEEAGANFDASLTHDVVKEPRKQVPAAPRPGRREREDDKRRKALDRLQTRPGKPGAARPGKADDKSKGGPAEPRRSRTTNVWMAPGARPLGEKKLAERAERTEGRRYAGKPKPAGPVRDGERSEKRGDKRGASRPSGSDRPGRAGPGARRPQRPSGPRGRK